MHRFRLILRYTVSTFAILFLALVIVLQLPSVQTWMAHKAIEKIAGRIDGTIVLDKIHIRPFNTIIINGLTIIDDNPCNAQARDTLCNIGTLSVRYSVLDLLTHKNIRLQEVSLRDASLNLVIENVDSTHFNNNLQRIFRIPPDKKRKVLPDKDLIWVKTVNISNFSYGMQNFKKVLRKFPDTAVQWDDVLVTNANATVQDFRIDHQIWSGHITHMDISEKCGWDIEDINCHVEVGKGLTSIKGLKIYDKHSSIDMDLQMEGMVEDYKQYVDSVRMVVDMRPSKWSGYTLARVIPAFTPDETTVLDLEGNAEGYVRDMYGRDLRLSAEHKTAELVLNGRISNLPDYKNVDMDVDLSEISVTTKDVFSIISSLMPKSKIKPGHKLANNTVYEGSLGIKGNLRKINVNLDLDQRAMDAGMGHLKLQSSLGNLAKSSRQPLMLSGELASDNFDIGAVLGNPNLGKTTLKTSVKASIPKKINLISGINATIDSLQIDGFEFKGCNYTDITGSLTMEDGDVTADIRSRSDAFRADVTLWSDKYSYNGSVAVQKADLKAMKFSKREISEVGFNIYARLDKDLKHPSGNVNISDIHLTNEQGTSRIDNIAAEAVYENDGYAINIESSVLSGMFHGNAKAFECSAEFYNTIPLLSFMAPGAYMEKGSRLQCTIDKDKNIHGSLMSGRIAFKDNYIKDMNLDVDGSLRDMHATLVSTNIHAATFNFGNNIVNIDKKDNTIAFDYSFFNSDERFRDGNIAAALTINGKKDFILDIVPSSFCMNNKRWELAKSHVAYKAGDLQVDNFELKNDSQLVKLDGHMSSHSADKLFADIQNFDLAVVDQLWEKFNLGLKGKLSLKGTVFSPVLEGMPLLDMSIKLDSLAASGVDIGTFYARSEYNPQKESFLISVNDKLGSHDVLSASATIWPSSREIEAYASLEGFPLGWAQRFIPKVFSKMDGTVSGNISVEGPFKKMRMRCRDGKLENVKLDVAFTKVPYELDGSFHIDDKGIHLDDVIGKDRFGNTAKGYGSLEWDHMRKLNMNISFDANNIEALNMPCAAEGGVFYGHIFGSGTVNFNGPFHSITMKGDVHSPTNSDLYIIVPNQHVASKSNLLTFVDPYDMEADPYKQIMEKFKRMERKPNFATDLHCLVGTGLRVHVDMDNAAFAAGISGVGSGDIQMSTNAKDGFRIFGDYTLQEGNMGFNVTKLIRRNFVVRNGSSIKFGDNIFFSDLDLFADYETKASITTLVADNNSVENRRLIQCGVHITGKMENPNLGFSVNIPDLNPSIKSQVESALDTEDKVQKQFLSILIAGTFLPGDMGGVVNGSSILYSNMSEIMSSQVNSIFTKLNIPVDLGLKYQPTETGKNLFDVAVSTQLFHNRVIIGGTFGNRQNLGTSSGTEMFGDLDIEYKVNKSGTLRVKAFSHAADQYSNYLDNSQRNGLGITWQQEFNKFSLWIKNLFKKKAVREQNEAEEIIDGRKTKAIILDE